jgi:ribose transport system permease protein
MKKIVGISLFLLILYVVLRQLPGGASADNHRELGQEIGLYSILSLGAGLLIISGGIDLSMGSVFALCGTLLPILVMGKEWPMGLAFPAMLLLGALIGAVHGLLVTKLRIQAFVVTLCGLFIYRGLARFVSGGQTQGFRSELADLRQFFNGAFLEVPMYLWIFFALAALAIVLLHFSIYGRYLYALGSNEKAAQYSGIATDAYKIAAFMVCGMLTALFAFLFLMKYNSIIPSSTGNMFELYAIAGAVLGGCSLRGGEGTVVGILVGTCIIRMLPNMINLSQVIPDSMEYVVIGGALLIGAILDEVMRRRGPGEGGLFGWLKTRVRGQGSTTES